MKGNLLSMRKEFTPDLTTWKQRKMASEEAKQRRIENAKENSVNSRKDFRRDDLHR